jgi:hypothetical protein
VTDYTREPMVLVPPVDPLWVNRLRTNNRIWLCKEQRYAVVDMPWEPPEPGHISGRLRIEIIPGHIQKWFVKGDGRGLDGKPLILPCEGHLDPEPPPVDEPVLLQLRREMAGMLVRIRRLEHRLQNLGEFFP